MTDYQENILDKRIKGLTWGVILTIFGVFGGGAAFIVSYEIGIQKELAKSNVKYDDLEKKTDGIASDLKNTNTRIDNFFLKK